MNDELPRAQAPRDRSILSLVSSKENAHLKRRHIDAMPDSDNDSSGYSGDESKRVKCDCDSGKAGSSESSGVAVDDDNNRDGAQELSDYEKLRLRNIERNNEVQSFLLIFASLLFLELKDEIMEYDCYTCSSGAA